VHAENIYGAYREFHVTLEPSGVHSYAGHLDDPLVIVITSPGHAPQSKEQRIEVLLNRGAGRESLIDPINGTHRFQVNLDWAQFSD